MSDTSEPKTKTAKAPVRRIVLHERIGEMRAALIDRDRVVDLRIERWSDHDTRARWGQVYAGRIRKVARHLNGAFLDLGLPGEQAFCPLPREDGPYLAEGRLIAVRIVREAEPGEAKGPVVVPVDVEGSLPAGPGLIEDVTPWFGWPGEPVDADAEDIERIEAAIAAALSVEVPVPGGGTLAIEQTRALVAIDVDSGMRPAGAGDPVKFARALNLAAVHEVVRQVRLRGLGGLICVDFAGPRKRGDPELITKALHAAFDAERNGGVDAPKTEVLPVSRFGVAEIARQKRRTGLAARLCGPGGALSAETVALNGLGLLVDGLGKSRGKVVQLGLPPDALAWLEADSIGWRDAVADGVGGRYELVAAPALSVHW
ncbi:MAG: ribonuclease E/G [Hyphomonadaceae bacterium]|jgi:Ribonuclease G/E|nr:ribonuclease E/G [Hyphomonadaceae bacterium]